MRDDLRELREASRRVGTDRDLALERSAAKCGEMKAQAKAWCASERDRIRLEARAARARLEEKRRRKWDNYRHAQGLDERAERHRPKYSAREHDSLTEHNVPPELVAIWREVKGNFPRTTTPDHRAELFLEWVDENKGDVAAWYADRLPSDADLAAEAERYEREQAAALEPEGELAELVKADPSILDFDVDDFDEEEAAPLSALKWKREARGKKERWSAIGDDGFEGLITRRDSKKDGTRFRAQWRWSPDEPWAHGFEMGTAADAKRDLESVVYQGRQVAA